MLNANRADVYTDFNGLAKLKTEARKESPEALKETAKKFEAVFLNHILKSMRETKLADGILDNDQSKFYGEMYDQQLATNLSGSIGLADLIVKQMKHEEHPNERNGKMNLEDYLNRSSSAGKTMTGRQGAVDSHMAGNAKLGQADPITGDIIPVDGAASSLAGSRLISGQNNASFLKESRGYNFAADEFALKNSESLPINSAQAFVKHLQPIAEQAAKELGVEPKVLLAQAALETNWGRSLVKNGDGESSFNLFNIKAGKTWQGERAQAKTHEFVEGVGRKVNSSFRSYESFEESFKDYVQLIKNNPRYGNALKLAANPEQYLHGLQQAGYATDPRYAEKVIKIYHGNTISDVQSDLVAAMSDQA